MITFRSFITGLGLVTITSVTAHAQTSILNASYDVSRELYKEINPAFVAHWKKEKGADVTVNQSHGGSTKQAQAVANGLEAMQLVLMALGVKAGDEVIVPSHGYIATWLAVTHVGATPVPVEPVPETYNLDPDRLEAAITPRTRVILPIHLYGQTADMPRINAVAQRHGLFVLEDAAQSHGARCHGRAAGALGNAAGVSFYPSKNLGALADAGAVTTNDDALADKLRHLRNYGSKVRYQNEYLGLNSRMSEPQAAFLRAKLPRLAEWNARRSRLALPFSHRPVLIRLAGGAEDERRG